MDAFLPCVSNRLAFAQVWPFPCIGLQTILFPRQRHSSSPVDWWCRNQASFLPRCGGRPAPKQLSVKQGYRVIEHPSHWREANPAQNIAVTGLRLYPGGQSTAFQMLIANSICCGHNIANGKELWGLRSNDIKRDTLCPSLVYTFAGLHVKLKTCTHKTPLSSI